MGVDSNLFKNKSGDIAFDLVHRSKLKFNISRYLLSFKKGKLRYLDIEQEKKKVSNIKREVVNNLDKYLNLFAENAASNGIEVIWTDTNKDVEKIIKDIICTSKAKLIVKGKSMSSEEINFNELVEKLGVDPVETDLGEFIVQTAGEKPYHILTPAMHKSKQDVADLFADKYSIPKNSSPEYMTDFVRKRLRHQFLDADIGVTGANFLIADIGGVALTENEGNILMSSTFPKIHIVIAGIEKLIPSFTDLAKIQHVLATHGTGQAVTAYNSVFTGPKKSTDIDGPEKMYVILLNNNRTKLLDFDKQFEALCCIRCGSCLNVCPIYKNIGGHVYSCTYTGPIGSVISPIYEGVNKLGHIAFACTQCGKCTETCPSKINLNKLLLYNRKLYNSTNKKTTEKFLFKLWSKIVMHSNGLDLGGVRMKNLFVKMFSRKFWGNKRKFPKFIKSFKRTV